MLLVVFLAITTLAGEHLYHLRRPRDILIKGRFLLPPGETTASLPRVEVILRYRRHRLRVDPSGRQRLAWRAPEVNRLWFDRPDGPVPYAFSWLKNGRYEIRIQPLARSLPRRAQLLFRFADGAQILSPRFRLYRSDRQRIQVTGWSYPVELKQMPSVKRTHKLPPSRLVQTSDSWERPEVDLSEGSAPPRFEDLEIRKRAVLALQRINRLSTRTLSLRYRLIEYLDAHPFYAQDPSAQRTRKIGMLLKDVSINKIRIVELLVLGYSLAEPASDDNDKDEDDPKSDSEEPGAEPEDDLGPAETAEDEEEEEEFPLPGD